MPAHQREQDRIGDAARGQDVERLLGAGGAGDLAEIVGAAEVLEQVALGRRAAAGGGERRGPGGDRLGVGLGVAIAWRRGLSPTEPSWR